MTIEERAKAYASGKFDEISSTAGYIKGATEQKEIDDAEHLRLMLKSDLECQGKLARYIIDKAWEWFEPFLKQNDAYIVNKLKGYFYEAMEK